MKKSDVKNWGGGNADIWEQQPMPQREPPLALTLGKILRATIIFNSNSLLIAWRFPVRKINTGVKITERNSVR